MLNLGARNGAEPTLSMLNEEVIAQDGSPELPALHPHTAGALARPFTRGRPRAREQSGDVCPSTVVRALTRRLLLEHLCVMNALIARRHSGR